jgi:Sulfotransferase family
MSVDELRDRPAAAVKASRNAPAIIVMTYAGSGADRLHSVLSAFHDLALTQRTGVLPLCHHAVTTWQAVDGDAGGAVPLLAAASVRALCSSLMTVILAREAGSRWCEFTSAPPAAAQTFARLYPHSQFLIVHRRADTMMRAVIDSSRWGLEGAQFAPFVSAHPANPAAALAEYWATRTAQQLEFEQTHPKICHRVRAEDLTANTAQAVSDIASFLALDSRNMFTEDDRKSSHDEERGPVTRLPLDRIPAPLLAQVNELHRSLGYSPVTATEND